MKMDGTTFKDTSDISLIIIDKTNVTVGWATLVSVTSRAANVAMGYEAMNILTSGGANTALCNTLLSVLLTSSDNVCMGNASRAAYISSESNNICISTINRGIKYNSFGSGSHNNYYYISETGLCISLLEGIVHLVLLQWLPALQILHSGPGHLQY
jgi:hypothetical protein